MDEVVIRVVFARGKPAKSIGWKSHAGVALAKSPPMLNSVREKDFREK